MVLCRASFILWWWGLWRIIIDWVLCGESLDLVLGLVAMCVLPPWTGDVWFLTRNVSIWDWQITLMINYLKWWVFILPITLAVHKLSFFAAIALGTGTKSWHVGVDLSAKSAGGHKNHSAFIVSMNKLKLETQWLPYTSASSSFQSQIKKEVSHFLLFTHLKKGMFKNISLCYKTPIFSVSN